MFTITSVDIHPAPPGDNRLLAFATIIVEDVFAVHDLRLIQVSGSAPFVAMPERKVQTRCPACHGKTPAVERYCCKCGAPVPAPGADQRLYACVCHPIAQPCRNYINEAVVAAWERQRRSGGPATQVTQ